MQLERIASGSMAAIYLARKLTGLSGRGVSSAFGVKEARVSNVIREIEEGGRKRLRARVERLLRGDAAAGGDRPGAPLRPAHPELRVVTR